jgi:hypothetical protein
MITAMSYSLTSLLRFAGFCIAALSSFYVNNAQSQTATPVAEDGLLWEISGKDLRAPSYLFGTYHLFTAGFVDTLPVVMKAFERCEAMAGEMIVDSSVMPQVLAAGLMQNQSLDSLLSAEEYDLVNEWFRELTGADLSLFNSATPMTVQTLLLTLYHDQLFSQPPMPVMDLYFQELAKSSGKKLIGLEQAQDQIHALFNQFSYERQAEMLVEFVEERDSLAVEMQALAFHYRLGQLDALEKRMNAEAYSLEEIETLLIHRNHNWMLLIPDLIRSRPTFIAVGALHLPGEHGLIQLLRNKGYKVSAVPLR